ncbi:hypothetical protein AKJ16_DCAP15156 [Drosera capensis]
MCDCGPFPLKLGFRICHSIAQFPPPVRAYGCAGHIPPGARRLAAVFASTRSEFGFKDKADKDNLFDEKFGGVYERRNDGRHGEGLSSFLEWKEKHHETVTGDEDFGTVENVNGNKLKAEEKMRLQKGGKQLIKRSNMIAKQVISIQTALSLGFVSQLWVDTSRWEVVMIELRHNLLSTDSDKITLHDIKQVGDVVLIQDESVLADDFRIIGLETLVGYEVVTPGRRSIGKVRGYSFNIYSGAVESLELDSFGFSIIPSSLVTTYALFIDDVIEVISDIVIVNEAAASRIQRVTKGIWGGHNVGRYMVDRKYYDMDDERFPPQPDEGEGHKARRSSSRRKSRGEPRDVLDDWEPPMDYL